MVNMGCCQGSEGPYCESLLVCMGPTTVGYLLSFHRLLLLQKVTEPELQAVTLLNGLFKFGLHVVNLKVQMEVRQNQMDLATPHPAHLYNQDNPNLESRSEPLGRNCEKKNVENFLL